MLLLLISTCSTLSAQELAKKVWQPYRISFGFQWQGAATENLINLSNIIPTYLTQVCGGGPCIPYNYERNIQGLGLTVGLAYRTNSLFEFHYRPVFRYDETRFADLNPQQRTKAFIINHKAGINKYFRAKNKRPNQYFGAYYAIFNTGKKIDFYDSFQQKDAQINLQFPALAISYGHAIYKNFYGEFQVHYLYKGLPHNHSRSYFLYGFALFYNHNFSFN